MVRMLDALHQHVIDVYLHGISNLIFDHTIDHPLEGGSRILQFEGHDLVAEDYPTSYESSLVLIKWVHLNLVVA